MISDTVFDQHLREALGPPPNIVSTAGMLNLMERRRSGRKRRLLFAVGVGLALALAAGGTVFASNMLKTVPVKVISGHPEAGSYAHDAPASGDSYKTTLEHAQAVAGFHILTLPAKEGPLESVTVSPASSISASHVTSIELEYRARGTVIQIVEDPKTPESLFQMNVKRYAAAQAHTATIDGVHIIYDGDSNATYWIGLQTTDGVVLFLRSDVTPSAKPLTVQQWVELANELS